MNKEELRELLWWAFREGSENQDSFIKADGRCLDLLDKFQGEVNGIVDKFEDE